MVKYSAESPITKVSPPSRSQHLTLSQYDQANPNECREEGDAFMFDPINWDQSPPVFTCNFLKVRLECLLADPCDSDVGTTNYTTLVSLLQNVINYYSLFGLCNDTIDDSLPYDHVIKIRERCLEESARRIKSPFAISCLETAWLTYCIYDEQVACGDTDARAPELYDNVQFLLDGLCAYKPPSEQLREDADEWRDNHLEYFEYEREYPCSATSHNQHYLIQCVAFIALAFQSMYNY
ncbi:uncharacterized protein LOC102802871 [Saccoglossus kowalevskii]|uniref:Uncharacterized protein LOC102802871 n=1 Tax=Saccoglossus kowalevskii TaxID=10224 RepID=A0ABM0MRE6_SACKO|nr:PREDICTED: uncharacterized protein LOC102802871 [Saccoglossus kowalevskii]